MNKRHSFSAPHLGSRTSPYLQEMIVLLGCEEVYGDVVPLVERLLGIDVSYSQVYRTCQKAAAALDEGALCQPSAELEKALGDPTKTVYVMVDGCMVFTDDGWQETKLCRVFEEEPVVTDGRPSLTRSEYVANRGHCGGLVEKVEKLVPTTSKCHLVFISDGASWISNWQKESYPDATMILDKWHVVEKLAEAARSAVAPKGWLEKQKANLKAGRANKVEAAVRALKNLKPGDKKSLLGYLAGNRYRMKYDEYRSAGLRIGSGAIEAAHKAVIQVRMKRSGQRWCDKGADNILNLRTAYKSGKFGLITDLFRVAA